MQGRRILCKVRCGGGPHRGGARYRATGGRWLTSAMMRALGALIPALGQAKQHLSETWNGRALLQLQPCGKGPDHSHELEKIDARRCARRT